MLGALVGLSILQVLCILIYNWVTRNVFYQPEWDIPPIVRTNPALFKAIGVGVPILYVLDIVLAFFITNHPWYFLVFSVVLYFAYLKLPRGNPGG
jgi:hypothetical protein